MAESHSKSPARSCKEKSLKKENSQHRHASIDKNLDPKKSKRTLLKQLAEQQHCITTLNENINQLNNHLGQTHDAFDEVLDCYRFLFKAVEVMQLQGNFDDEAVYGLGPIVEWLDVKRAEVG